MIMTSGRVWTLAADTSAGRPGFDGQKVLEAKAVHPMARIRMRRVGRHYRVFVGQHVMLDDVGGAVTHLNGGAPLLVGHKDVPLGGVCIVDRYRDYQLVHAAES